MVDELIANNYKVMFYTNKDGYNKFIKGNFDDYPLWLCAFSKPENIEWTIWQYSHWGEVDGIKGEVDLNIFMVIVSNGESGLSDFVFFKFEGLSFATFNVYLCIEFS